MIQPEPEPGLSSFFFIISYYNVVISSSLLWWKLTNVALIFASYYYYSNEYSHSLLLLDYFAIYSVCSSYINNYNVNYLLFHLLLLEYKLYNTIVITKNITYFVTMCKSLQNTYIYCSSFCFGGLLTAYFLSYFLYGIRYYLYSNNHYEYFMSITFLLHFQTMIILWILSYTAK